MQRYVFYALLWPVLSLHPIPGFAQNAKPAVSGRDTLILIDDEKLIGQFERADSSEVTFKSDLAGEVQIKWSNIQELHSPQRFAVAEKGVPFSRQENIAKIPQGTLTMEDQKLQVRSKLGAPSQTIPVADTNHVIDEVTFIRAMERPGVFENWKGGASFGTSLVLATQKSRMFTSAVSLTREVPVERWMEPENRTLIDFSSSYGKLTQPEETPVKTSIFHADAERDEYFSSRQYAFVEGAFDHNYSQGLDLQQTFGSGVGWTVVKEAKQELDLRGELTYVHQQLADASLNQELIGSTFSQRLNRTFVHGIVLQEQMAISPAWNNTNAYSATGAVSLTVPVRKHLGITMGTLDTFLNNPSPGFKKNSFQATTAITYTRP